MEKGSHIGRFPYKFRHLRVNTEIQDDGKREIVLLNTPFTAPSSTPLPLKSDPPLSYPYTTPTAPSVVNYETPVDRRL